MHTRSLLSDDCVPLFVRSSNARTPPAHLERVATASQLRGPAVDHAVYLCRSI